MDAAIGVVERNPRENSRLTALVGSLLLVMLAIEGISLVSVRSMLSLHVVVGVALIAPVVVKLASTGYRFARYYSRDPAYVRSGPPHPIMRTLGPLVIASTLTLLASGVALIAIGSRNDAVLTIHKASFVVWLVITSLHVLGHLRSLPRVLRGRSRGETAPVAVRSKRRGVPFVVTGGALAIGLVAGGLSLPAARGYHGGRRHFRDDESGHVGPAAAATAAVPTVQDQTFATRRGRR
jgi:hypothetical protein